MTKPSDNVGRKTLVSGFNPAGSQESRLGNSATGSSQYNGSGLHCETSNKEVSGCVISLLLRYNAER